MNPSPPSLFILLSSLSPHPPLNLSFVLCQDSYLLACATNESHQRLHFSIRHHLPPSFFLIFIHHPLRSSSPSSLIIPLDPRARPPPSLEFFYTIYFLKSFVQNWFYSIFFRCAYQKGISLPPRTQFSRVSCCPSPTSSTTATTTTTALL